MAFPNYRQQRYLVCVDGRDGGLKWLEPLSNAAERNSYSWGGVNRFVVDASADINNDGTRDIVITIPMHDEPRLVVPFVAGA